jgi:PEP-CTERM motif-containing protein
MKRLNLILFVLVTLALTFPSNAALLLRNGDFDSDPDLGGSDDSVAAPTFWYTGSTVPQSWNDFRFGNNGNGSWNNNGIALGQDYLGPNFDPGPEVGYFYTSLGAYAGEISALLQGFGYNRVNQNPAGSFIVSFYYTPAGTFAGGDGVDVSVSGGLLSSETVDISALTGPTARSQLFTLSATLANSGINPGDQVWLHIGDGPDNGDLNSFDEPIIDNLSLTVVIPEPSSVALALMGGGLALVLAVVRRRRSIN